MSGPVPELIDLSSGQVVEPFPEAAAKAVGAVLADPLATAYAPGPGDPALRAAVAAHYARRTGRAVDPGTVTITAGGRAGLLAAVSSVAAGGAVLVPAPHWSHYPTLVTLAGARPVLVPGDPARGWVATPALLDRARTDDTRAVLLNSPVNPTGTVYDPPAAQAIREWARTRGLQVVVDDMYWAYGGEPGRTPLAGSHEVVVGGTAKVHALAGLRIGWVWADPALGGRVRDVVEHTTGPVSVLAQAAAAAVLDDERAVTERVRRLASLRDHAVAVMSAVPFARPVPPAGGIYLCLDVADALPALGAGDDRELCAQLRDRAGVGLRAGSTFGLPGHVRLCVAADPALLTEAARRLADHAS